MRMGESDRGRKRGRETSMVLEMEMMKRTMAMMLSAPPAVYTEVMTPVQ